MKHGVKRGADGARSGRDAHHVKLGFVGDSARCGSERENIAGQHYEVQHNISVKNDSPVARVAAHRAGSGIGGCTDARPPPGP